MSKAKKKSKAKKQCLVKKLMATLKKLMPKSKKK